MKTRIPFLNSSRWCALILLAVTAALVPSKTCAQSILDDIGNQKNGPEDIANSLVPAPPKFGKGEKKEQINAAQLKSKSMNDSTFGGSLLNSGLTGSEPKLDEQKLRAAPAEKEPSASKQSGTTGNQESASKQSDSRHQVSVFSNLSETATLAQQLDEPEPDTTPAKENVSTAAGSSARDSSNNRNTDSQKKDQTATTHSTASDEKASPSPTPKTAVTKPDGDR